MCERKMSIQLKLHKQKCGLHDCRFELNEKVNDNCALSQGRMQVGKLFFFLSGLYSSFALPHVNSNFLATGFVESSKHSM